ncbi:MAG: phosphate signaling complex protein PhoU [Actinomycetia bacterium]|nr:phosphate signaling complex protein PhoU [Actinomycetes bacterium]
MVRTNYDRQMAEMNRLLLTMGAAVENAIEMAVQALADQDRQLAEKTIISDDEIDSLEKEIEQICLNLILRQQPVAGDLRRVSTVLKMITDLERIGDHAEDISEITLLLTGSTYAHHPSHIFTMAEITKKMVTDSLNAFVRDDRGLARAVIGSDDQVDQLFCMVKSDLIALVHEDIAEGEKAMDWLMVAKYLERVGDHAVNIAEWVIFSITGQHKNSRIL